MTCLNEAASHPRLLSIHGSKAPSLFCSEQKRRFTPARCHVDIGALLQVAVWHSKNSRIYGSHQMKLCAQTEFTRWSMPRLTISAVSALESQIRHLQKTPQHFGVTVPRRDMQGRGTILAHGAFSFGSGVPAASFTSMHFKSAGPILTALLCTLRASPTDP